VLSQAGSPLSRLRQQAESLWRPGRLRLFLRQIFGQPMQMTDDLFLGQHVYWIRLALLKSRTIIR
jgi:hypothetical protein